MSQAFILNLHCKVKVSDLVHVLRKVNSTAGERKRDREKELHITANRVKTLY